VSDLAAEIPAYGALAIAVGSFFWNEHRFRSQRDAKRAVGPALDTREALIRVRDDLQSISSKGGIAAKYFSQDGREYASQRLLDLSDRTEDTDLGTAIVEIAELWDNVAAYVASPTLEMQVWPGHLPGAREELQRLRAKQVELARNGIGLCRTALDRLNALDRPT